MRKLQAVLFVVAGLVALPEFASAVPITIYESATLGATGQRSGLVVDSSSFLGVS